jgi:5-methylcytosine-specific restriction enzyme A
MIPGTSRPAFGPRLYDARWQRYRLRFLRQNPLCVRCLEAGRTTAANTVDHIEAHRGSTALFWDPTNHQSLCSTCHSGDKQRAEKSGNVSYRGSNTDGTPLDPSHRWNVTDSTDEATVERYRQSGASL